MGARCTARLGWDASIWEQEVLQGFGVGRLRGFMSLRNVFVEESCLLSSFFFHVFHLPPPRGWVVDEISNALFRLRIGFTAFFCLSPPPSSLFPSFFPVFAGGRDDRIEWLVAGLVRGRRWELILLLRALQVVSIAASGDGSRGTLSA